HSSGHSPVLLPQQCRDLHRPARRPTLPLDCRRLRPAGALPPIHCPTHLRRFDVRGVRAGDGGDSSLEARQPRRILLGKILGRPAALDSRGRAERSPERRLLNLHFRPTAFIRDTPFGGYFPGLLGSGILSAAFMIGELVRRSSLAYIIASAVFFT